LEQYTQYVPVDKDSHLYVYAIVRGDLEMNPGKLAAQAGHAYTDTLYKSYDQDSELFHNYRVNGKGGSKVTLVAKNENHLLTAYQQCLDANVPCSIVVDREHVMLPHFDGSPTITALGIGPCTKAQVKSITKKFQCVR
jgi:PTH2 family peptidyl-tRNA hydrolase